MIEPIACSRCGKKIGDRAGRRLVSRRLMVDVVGGVFTWVCRCGQRNSVDLEAQGDARRLDTLLAASV